MTHSGTGINGIVLHQIISKFTTESPQEHERQNPPLKARLTTDDY
jgi:hypothetical protein